MTHPPTDGVPEQQDLRLTCEEEAESLARLPIHYIVLPSGWSLEALPAVGFAVK